MKLDMHRAFHIAENLMYDDELNVAYAGISYVPADEEGPFQVELFAHDNEDRTEPDFVVRTEHDYSYVLTTIRSNPDHPLHV